MINFNKYKTKYRYNDGDSVFIIYYKNQIFKGEAFCHSEDSDMESERVGLTIAEARANIAVMRFIRDFEIKPQLKILQHLYSNMQNSKYYNSKSYESKMLRKQIGVIRKELTAINNDIADEQQFIKDYINGKDTLYKKLRGSRTNNS